MNLKKTQAADGILIVTISRPEALNALNAQVMDDLEGIIRQCYEDHAIRGLIITGEGEKAFVAGADIRELAALNREQARELALRGQKIFKSIEDCPKPVIAAVNGFALGGGCELAMACHIRIATANAKFGQPEVNLGIIPGYGGTQRMVQLLGRGKALELLMTGDMISADEAKSLGLVNHVVADRNELDSLAEKIMKKIIAKAPLAISAVIRAVNDGFSFEDKGYTSEADLFASCSETGDFKEGTSAFLEKRPPAFKGK